MSRPVTTAIQTWNAPAPAATANTGVYAAITLPASGTTVATTSITNAFWFLVIWGAHL